MVYTVETLEKVANLAKEHDLLVFSDEIYNQITYDGVSCPSIASFPGMKERTIHSYERFFQSIRHDRMEIGLPGCRFQNAVEFT